MTLTEHHLSLDQVVERAGALYSLPAVAVEVLQLTNRPTVDVPQLKQCISNDPALVSKVLRVVNSSLFALSREVSDLNQALALLGTKPLKLLVLGFSLPDGLFVGVAGEMLRRYWRRTLTKAVAAREISETLWNLPGDEAFLAGLLQDIGMMVLLQQMGEPYARFLDLALAKAPDVGALGERSLGFDHAQLSARLLEKWGLPASLVWSIAAGRPAEKLVDLSVATRALPQILYLAELLAGLLTENRADLLPELLQAAERLHRITPGQLKALVASLQAKVEQLADALSLELPATGDYNDVLVTAHARLSEVAADAAGDLLQARQAHDSAAQSESLLAEVQSLRILARDAAKPQASLGVPAAPQPSSLTPHPSPLIPPTAVSVTGDPALLGALRTIVASCRQSRCALALMLVGIDNFDDVVAKRGVGSARRMVELIGTICRGTIQPDALCRQVYDDRFLLILPRLDRDAAVDLGKQLLRELRRVGAPNPPDTKPTMTASVGISAVTLPTKNFQPDGLLAGVERCLHAAQVSGGNSLKSIETY